MLRTPPRSRRALTRRIMRTVGIALAWASLATARAAAPADVGDACVAANGAWAAQTFAERADGELPFSFTYGGRPSAELVRTWKRRVEERQVDATQRRRTLTLTDPDTGLEVSAVGTIYTDTPGVDWTLYITNRGSKDTPILEDVRAVDVFVPVGQPHAPVVLHRLNGGPCRVDDWMPFDRPLAPGEKAEFEAVGGRSSNICPFFNISWGDGGIITAIGWSGQWAASVQRGPDGNLRIQAGMERLHLRLHPGESIRSPRILQLRWSGNDHLDSYNHFRHTMFAHISPRIEGQLVTPPITTPSPWAVHEGDPWKYIYGFKEAAALEEIKCIIGLGYEFYWTDAYYTRDNFPAGMGNYGLPLLDVVPDRERFPRGLRPISDAAHEAGMKYVVWFEPERVVRGTTIANEHADYVIWRDGDNSGLYNLGIPEAREYMTKFLSTAIDEWRMECLRIDFNIDPLPFWQQVDKQDPDRVGLCEIRYVEGLYRMWDDLRKAHPRLFIDNCASGGRRIDLETCARSIPLWRTDATIEPYLKFDYNQTALQNQVMTAGLSRYMPFSTSGSIGAKPYPFRSGFNYGVPIAERPIDTERELLKQAIAEGKRLRKYYLGDFYALGPVTTSAKDWCVLQYHRPKEQDGMLVAFRRHESSAASFACEHVRGIDPAADYLVTESRTYTPAAPVTMKGTALSTLNIVIDECPGSVIVEYRRAAGRP
jgi:alpha-galactosidase